jgi:predicted amidohydrolase YtcJ
LHGKLVLPGIHDSHIHVQGLGESVGYLDLFGCESLGDFKERLRSHLQASKSESGASSSSWIIGFGWEQDKLGRYPSRQDLDEIVRERPVLLWRACFHVAVVNTKALEVAGFDLKNGPWEVPGGLVDVDNGSPTGILREAVSPYSLSLLSVYYT